MPKDVHVENRIGVYIYAYSISARFPHTGGLSQTTYCFILRSPKLSKLFVLTQQYVCLPLQLTLKNFKVPFVDTVLIHVLTEDNHQSYLQRKPLF